MNINLIGVPLYYGCDIKGVDEGPRELRKSGIKKILEKNNEVHDLGNIFVRNCKEENKYKKDRNAKYLEEILEVNENLAHSVYLSLSNNSFPIVLGGDHSLALGSISGTARYYSDNLAVIWIDAHGDFNTTNTSISGNVHGMPLASLAGVGREDMINLYFDGAKLRKENIFIIGARDLDKEEIRLINENRIKIWSTYEVKKLGKYRVLKEIISDIDRRKIENIHISFDIDCIDPKYMPGTGTKVEEGMDLYETIEILQYLFSTNKVRALDFVEFNPKLDKTDTTLKNCLSIVEKISEFIGSI